MATTREHQEIEDGARQAKFILDAYMAQGFTRKEAMKVIIAAAGASQPGRRY